MTASAWDKFLLLSWKNWIIQIRHPIQTAFEVFVPVAVCALLIVIRGLVEVNEFSEDFLYKPDRVNVVDRVPFDGLRILTYSPENDVLHGIIDTAAKNLNFNGAVGFANAELLQNNATLSNPFASIEFDDSWSVRYRFVPILSKFTCFLPNRLSLTCPTSSITRLGFPPSFVPTTPMN